MAFQTTDEIVHKRLVVPKDMYDGQTVCGLYVVPMNAFLYRGNERYARETEAPVTCVLCIAED